MIITKKYLSRRTMLRGMGAAVSLPLLESMLPAQTPLRQTEAGRSTRSRLACLEMVHGSAGAAKHGADKNLWSPAAEGHDFDLTPGALLPLEPYRQHLTIVSNADARNAEAFSQVLPFTRADVAESLLMRAALQARDDRGSPAVSSCVQVRWPAAAPLPE